MNTIIVTAHGAPNSFARRVQHDPTIAVECLRLLVELRNRFEHNTRGPLIIAIDQFIGEAKGELPLSDVLRDPDHPEQPRFATLPDVLTTQASSGKIYADSYACWWKVGQRIRHVESGRVGRIAQWRTAERKCLVVMEGAGGAEETTGEGWAIA